MTNIQIRRTARRPGEQQCPHRPRCPDAQAHDRSRARTTASHPEQVGLNLNRFRDDLLNHVYATRVAQDIESADLSGVSGTPTFFINGQRHYGAFDLPTLTAAIRTTRDQVVTARPTPAASGGWSRPRQA